MSTSQKIQAFLKKNTKILLIIISVIIFITVLYGYFKWKYRCCENICYCPVGNRPRDSNSYSSEKCKCVKKKGFYPSDSKVSPKKESYKESPRKGKGESSKKVSPKKGNVSPNKGMGESSKGNVSPKKGKGTGESSKVSVSPRKDKDKRKDSPNNKKR